MLIREPLYQQIVSMLRQELMDGRYSVSSRFPSERELAQRFEVSRTTANKILSVLVADGLLQHRKGVGAFVVSKPLEHDMSGLLSFTEQARMSGFEPMTQVLVYEQTEHPDMGSVIYLERLRSVDSVPVIYERRWLAQPVCAGVTSEMATGSLYAALKELGITIGHAEQRARAVSADEHERQLLQVKPGCACLRVEGRGYLSDGSTIWEENTLFRGDRYELHGTLNPTAKPFGSFIQN